MPRETIKVTDRAVCTGVINVSWGTVMAQVGITPPGEPEAGWYVQPDVEELLRLEKAVRRARKWLAQQ